MKSCVLVSLVVFSFSCFLKAEESILLTSPVLYQVLNIRVTGSLDSLTMQSSQTDCSAVDVEAQKATSQDNRTVSDSSSRISRGHQLESALNVRGGVGPGGVKFPNVQSEIAVKNKIGYEKTVDSKVLANSHATSVGRESSSAAFDRANNIDAVGKRMKIYVDVDVKNVSTNEYELKRDEVIEGVLRNGANVFRVKHIVERDLILKAGMHRLFVFTSIVEDMERVKQLTKDEFKGLIEDNKSSQLIFSQGQDGCGFKGFQYPNGYEKEVKIFFEFGHVKEYSPFYVRAKSGNRSISIAEAFAVIGRDYIHRLRHGEILIPEKSANMMIYDQPVSKVFDKGKIIVVLSEKGQKEINQSDFVKTPLNGLDLSIKRYDSVEALIKNKDIKLSSVTLTNICEYALNAEINDQLFLPALISRIASFPDMKCYGKKLKAKAGIYGTSADLRAAITTTNRIELVDCFEANRCLSDDTGIWHMVAVAGAWELFDIIDNYCSIKGINEVDACGMTPLMWAAMKADVRTCQELVKRGADVCRTIRHDDKTQFLRKSWIQKMKNATVKEILDARDCKDKDIHCKNIHLEINAFDGDADCNYSRNIEDAREENLQSELKRFAKMGVHARESYFSRADCNMTAVDYAGLFNPDKNVCRYLLAQLWWDKFTKKGRAFSCDLTKKSDTCLMATCVLSGLDVNYVAKQWLTNCETFGQHWWKMGGKSRKRFRLTPEIMRNDLDLVKWLINKGFDINCLNDVRLDLSPLALAAEMGDVEVVRLIADRSSSLVEQKNEDGDAALLCALQGLYENRMEKEGTKKKSYEECVALLIKAGANIDVRLTNERYELTPLTAQELAVQCVTNHTLLSSLLKDSIKTQNEKGESLLMFASSAGNRDAVEFILSHGGSTTNSVLRGGVFSKRHLTAKDFAREKGYCEIVELLEKHETQ